MSKIELLPCPFCGGPSRLESNRDWHRIYGDHSESCVFDSDTEMLMCPATDDQLELVVGDWNRRAQPDSHAPAQELLDRLLEQLVESGAENYQESIFNVDLGSEQISAVVTLQHKDKPSAHELRTTAEQKCEELTKRLDTALEFLRHVKKCLRDNGEYAPLSHQELDSILRIGPYATPGKESEV